MEEIKSQVSLCNKNHFMNIYVGTKLHDMIFQTRLTAEQVQRIIQELHRWSSQITSRDSIIVQYYKEVHEIHQLNTVTRIGCDEIRQYTGRIVYRSSQDKDPFYFQMIRSDTDTTIPASNSEVSHETTYGLMVFRIHGQFSVELRNYGDQYHECILHVDKPVFMWKLSGCLDAIRLALK